MTDDYITKDSGSYREFPTGSIRDNAEGKGRFDLLSPIALMRLAKLYERGCKYGPRNWEKGQPMSVLMDSAIRHMMKHMMGYRDEDHLAAILWNISAIIHYEHMIERGMMSPELDDLPCYLTEDERK